ALTRFPTRRSSDLHAVSDPLPRRSTLLARGHQLLSQLGQLTDLLVIDTQGVTQTSVGVLGLANHPHSLVGEGIAEHGLLLSEHRLPLRECLPLQRSAGLDSRNSR